MQSIPGIHVHAERAALTAPCPVTIPAHGRQVVSAGLGEWLRSHCDSRFAPSHTFAEYPCGVVVLMEGYLTGISGLSGFDGYGVQNILQLHLDHGLELLPRLRGSYTGLILDARTQTAHLFNDRRASRPVFVREDSDSLRIGPELAALASQTPALEAIDPVGVCEFVLFASYYNQRTLFPGIRKLPPATVLTLAPDGRCSASGYWALQIDPDRGPGNDGDWVEQAVEQMDRACRTLHAACASPALLLSGGGDSRAILGGLRRTGQSVDAVSYGTDEGDDASIARQLAETSGSSFTYFHIPTEAIHTRLLDAALRSDGQAETIDTPGLGNLYDQLATSRDGYIHGDKSVYGKPATSADQALGVVGLIGLDAAKRFGDMLDAQVRAAVDGSIAQTLYAMREAGRSLHPVDLRDKLYFEQRLANRQNGFAAMKLRQLEQVRPWLDEDFVDLMMRIPAELRADEKSFVKRVVARGAPDLAMVPYAVRDSIPQSQTFRQLIPRQAELAEFIRVQFGSELDPRIAALFRPGELQRLIASLIEGTTYPTPSRIWWASLPGMWRLTAHRYGADLVHPVRIMLRIMQINLLLGAIRNH